MIHNCMYFYIACSLYFYLACSMYFYLASSMYFYIACSMYFYLACSMYFYLASSMYIYLACSMYFYLACSMYLCKWRRGWNNVPPFFSSWHKKLNYFLNVIPCSGFFGRLFMTIFLYHSVELVAYNIILLKSNNWKRCGLQSYSSHAFKCQRLPTTIVIIYCNCSMW